jgi:high-affinity iron transporter
MLPSFLLALREGVEAALVIGILLGALRKLQRSELSAAVWWGLICALLASALAAAALTLVGAELEEPYEQIFEGLTMLAAAGLLTWMIFWMHGQSRFMKGKIEQNVRLALGTNGRRALFGVTFLAVVREGIELALFLAAAGLASNPTQELSGALLGLLSAAGLGWLLFSSTRRLPLGRFFQVTNILLLLFAAGLVGHAVGEFNEIGWIPPLMNHVYNLNPVLSDSSGLGQVLSALFGYSAGPSLTQTLGYLFYFGILSFSLFWIQHRPALSTAQNS